MSTQGTASDSPVQRFAAWMSTRSGIASLFVVGLALRLLLARGGGFPFDMSSFGAWAATLADRGPWNFYPFSGDKFFVDYPPGYLYVMWILGVASKALRGSGPSVLMIKLPAIFADLGLAWVVSELAVRLSPGNVARKIPIRALAAAAILLNPAVFFISAVWGQADSVLALLVVGSFLLIGTGEQTFRREAGGVALLAVAFGTKPQTIFVVPIVALLLVWRHLRRDPEAVVDPLERRRAVRTGIGRIASLAGVGVAAGFLLFLPFRLYPARAFDFYVHASRTYKITSVFAFNLWGAVGFWKPDSGNAKGVVKILGVPAVIWGIAAFVAIGAVVLARAWRALRDGEDEGRVLAFGGVAITLVSFAVVTRVHERYLFLPLALFGVLVSNRWMRRAFVFLSVLYLVNVYFPYVYYLDYVHRPSPKLGGLYDVLYGSDIGGVRMRLLCLVVGVSCLAIAWLGWRALAAKVTDVAPEPLPDALPAWPPFAMQADDAELVPPARKRWTLELHPVGRRGAGIALAVFAVALLSRVAGLGHPPGMYFDEVYHARAGAEYLGHKEVFEYTHPPLAKELIGFAIQHFSGFNGHAGAPLPAGVVPASIAPRSGGLVWARNAEGATRIQTASIDGACSARSLNDLAFLDVSATGLAANDTSIFVAGNKDGASELVKLNGTQEQWRATLPGPATQVVALGDHAYVVTRDGDLVSVSAQGDPKTLAVGAGSISAGDATEAWVSFPSEAKIASYDASGTRTSTIETGGEPGAIGAHKGSQRVFVAVADEVIAYDTERDGEHARLPEPANAIGTVPETNIVWAVDGTQVRAIEPLSAVVVGRVAFSTPPSLLTADPVKHRLVGIADGRLECAGGRPQFAWRIGSAIMGALMVAFLFLLALRLFGNTLLALLASLFLAIDGLAFTISRIAMNDSYSMAFVLGAWFCVASALHAWGRRRPDDPVVDDYGDEVVPAGPPTSRATTAAWLLGTGMLGGLGLASKWPALYALAGIGLLVLWDGFDRRERSVWRVLGPFVPSALFVLVALAVVPLALYFLTYIPYMSLGHRFVDVLTLQESMFNYHATLKATHPFGSPWYGWPWGYKAVYLYVHTTATTRAEIWTFPNLVVFWGGLVGMVAAARDGLRMRSSALVLVVGAAALQYLPWTLVSRVTFMYHYLPVVPFLALALAWFLVEGSRDLPQQRRRVLFGVVGLAVAFFAFTYPILVGWDMPTRYFDLTRLFSWVIP